MFYVNWEWWTNNTGSTVRCQICDELVGSGELVKGVKGARWYYVHPECLEKYIKYDEMRTKALSRFFSGKNDEGEEIFKSITKIGIEINQTIVEIDDITKFLETLKDKKEIIEAAKKSKQSFMRKVKPYLVPLDNKFSRLFEEYEKEIRQNKARLNRLEDLTDEDVKERDEVNDLIKNMEMKYDNFKKRYNMTRKTILEITYEDLRPVGLHFRPDNPIESRTDYKKIINEAEEKIWIIDNYYNKQSLELLVFTLDWDKTNVTDIRILTSTRAKGFNDNQFRDFFTNIKKELAETYDPVIDIQMKVITNNLIKKHGKTHDRYFLSSRLDNSFTYASEAYVFDQTNTISRLKDVKRGETVAQNFEKLWNDSGALDFLKDWEKLSEREMFKATCSDCSNECEVPFEPDGERPVYCKDCFEKNRKNR